jgi:hypothetical protein
MKILKTIEAIPKRREKNHASSNQSIKACSIRIQLKNCFIVLLLTIHYPTFAANAIKNIEISINDTSSFSYNSDAIIYKGEKFFPFRFFQDDFQAEVKVWPNEEERTSSLVLLPSSKYLQIDSSLKINNDYYLFHLQFIDILDASPLSFRFKIVNQEGKEIIEEIKLLPYTTTQIKSYITDNDLFIGEEKIFELFSNMPENIKFPIGWITGQDFDYRLQYQNNQIRLHIVPKSLGKKTLQINLSTVRPDIIEGRTISYNLPPLSFTFNVKSGRLAFLNLDRKELTYDEVSRKDGVEVQIDNHRMLLINKTYRIEDQEKAGGALIGELYTRQSLNNDKVLCLLRVYNLHRPIDGYLYIKDGDIPMFITNFGISPKTAIQKISILRNGIDWIESNVVYPGETVNVKLEGVGIQKANFKFEELDYVIKDSIVQSDFAVEYKIKIPVTISKKKIYIYNYGDNTGSFLQVKEYQRPRNFDYIFINLGNGNKSIESYTGPELFEKTLKNIIISFDPNKIDEQDKFYGKQYVDISIKITGSNGELVEIEKLPTLVICPGDKSLRHNFYDSKDCSNEEISINNYLDKKTYDFDDWTKIRITFKNAENKYAEPVQERTVEIILQRKIKFDIDVSFPSLLTKIVKEEGWENGLGVSMAMIAQLSFYQKDKIARFLPFKIGMGFLALNAFNFSNDNNTRDLGLVILGSAYPTRKDTKLSFPLYIGGGYLLNKGSWFWVFGPGIRVSF